MTAPLTPERVNALLAASTGPIRLRRLSKWRRRLGRLIGSNEINDADCDLIESAHDIAEEYLAVVVDVARLRAQVAAVETLVECATHVRWAGNPPATVPVSAIRAALASGEQVQP